MSTESGWTMKLLRYCISLTCIYIDWQLVWFNSKAVSRAILVVNQHNLRKMLVEIGEVESAFPSLNIRFVR